MAGRCRVAQPGSDTRTVKRVDRGRNLPALITLAARDTLVRHDVYSLDLLAWALHRDARSHDALPLARRAMSLGSMEPLLRYHAGMIEWAVGDRGWARQHLQIALGRRRALSAAQVDEIRRCLESSRN